ncbi:hypothetical protein D1216_23580 [Vibrio parahaemolyticus]|nr:hypothetical protein [Vibrio parahaemolyticus]
MSIISTKKRVFLVSSLAMIVSSTVWASATQYQFTANAKEASDYTKQSNDAVYKKLISIISRHLRMSTEDLLPLYLMMDT